MKNNKGMTLMETIIAIMVLSIASLMILSGFSAVIQTMGRASEIKNNSDTMLAYAEKSSRDDVRNNIRATKKNVSYSLIYGNGNTIDVDATLTNITMKDSNKIALKRIQKSVKEAIQDIDAYLDINANANLTYRALNAEVKAWQEDHDKQIQLDMYGYNITLSELYAKQKYYEFDRSLLPLRLQNYATSNRTFYMKGCYPWEYSESTSMMTHGGLLMYLSQDDSEITEASKEETLDVIYDYDANQWYYYPYGTSGHSTKYTLTHDRATKTNTGIRINGNARMITSWNDMKMHIKDSKNGWQLLDIQALYDAGNPDAAWRDLN